jgi:hypothetical protein
MIWKGTNVTLKSISRWIFAVLAIVIAVGCIIATIIIVRHVSMDAGIEDIPYNDLTSKSIETRLNLSQSLFQVSLLIIGILWGLIIAKKDETQLVFSEYPEMIMFISGSTLLLLSLCSHTIYINNISHYLAVAAQAFPSPQANEFISMPNFFDQNVNYLFIVQVINLIAGICAAVITLISAHRLKEV